ncbi:hypothetical protein VPH35_136826 [Triticum aestivum]
MLVALIAATIKVIARRHVFFLQLSLSPPFPILDWQIVVVKERAATTARRFTNPKVHLHPNYVICASVDCFFSTLKLGCFYNVICMIQHKIYLPSLVWIHIPVAKFYYQINST